MNALDVTWRLRVIRSKARAGNDESARGLEEECWHAVLRAIARGKAEDARALAIEALKTRDIDFPRAVRLA